MSLCVTTVSLFSLPYSTLLYDSPLFIRSSTDIHRDGFTSGLLLIQLVQL